MTTNHTIWTFVRVHAAALLKLNPHNYTNDEIVDAVRELTQQEPEQWLTETEPEQTDPLVTRIIRAARFLYKFDKPGPSSERNKRLLDVLTADQKVPNALRMFPQYPKEGQPLQPTLL